MTIVRLDLNASGALAAAKRGDLVIVVDIIDMSTSAEAALEAGAIAIFGAASDAAHPPVPVNPEKMGLAAGEFSLQNKANVIVVAEPRYGNDVERRNNAVSAIKGLQHSGASIIAEIIPNIGTEIDRLADFNGKVVLIVSETGGAAFDAAYNAGAAGILTATVVRTRSCKGEEPARRSADRAFNEARRLDSNITVIAASANSCEDVLAAEFIKKLLIELGCFDFVNIEPSAAGS